MLHSFKHAAPASVRRPSQDGYRPRDSELRSSGDFRRTAHQRQSLDVQRRPPRHSSSDLYRPPRRRASEPLRHTYSDGAQSIGLARPLIHRLEPPKEEGHPAEANGVAVCSFEPTLEQTASPTAFEGTQGVDGSVSPAVQLSIGKHRLPASIAIQSLGSQTLNLFLLVSYPSGIMLRTYISLLWPDIWH